MPQSKTPSSTTQARAVVRPLWPALEPLPPREDLDLHHVLADQILTVSGFFTAKFSAAYVKFLGSLPLTTTPGLPKRGQAVRVNDRFQVDDADFAHLLWTTTGLKELVLSAVPDGGATGSSTLWGGEVVGLNPNIRIYRYSKGQFFDQHYDDSNSVTIPGQAAMAAKTTWTILLYLTSRATGCQGGETVFYPDAPATGKRKRSQGAPGPIVVSPEVGLLLLHRHGKDCMVHEGREVTDGEKWIIRTDLCVKR